MKRFLAVPAVLAVSLAFASLPAGQASASGGSVLPAGFRAQSQSWVSPKHGWLLGAATCGSSTCTAVAATTDGGSSWKQIGVIPAPLTNEQKEGVTEIRFADNLHGWAFLPNLWATTDGGRTWRQESPHGRPTIALAADPQVVYKVVSACPYNFMSIDNCTHDETLWRTTPGDATWTHVVLNLPKQIQALLALHGETAYVGVPTFEVTSPDELFGTGDGQTWNPLTVPCDLKADEHLMGLSAPTDTTMALLCQGNEGFGQAEKRVFKSNDDGATLIFAGQLPFPGITGTQIAMAPNGVIIVTSAGAPEDSFIYRNSGGTTWEKVLDISDGAAGWNDPLFTTSRIGWAIHANAACCGNTGSGQLGLSTDGGVTWNPI
jgi:photosystem II stability/assembly factor-like uncharacterized protein